MEPEPAAQRLLTAKDIPFPTGFTRNGQHDKMIQEILSAIQESKDCILQAATGTGKTFCMLASALQSRKHNKVSKIIYVTRTHSQIDCILEQIKKIRTIEKYSDVRFGIKQSKKALCAEKSVREAGEDATFEQFENLCKQARENAKIPPLQGSTDIRCNRTLRSISSEDAIKCYNSQKRDNIESIQQMAETICPHSMESALSKCTELVVLTYSYLFDPYFYYRLNLNEENESASVMKPIMC